MRVDLWNDEGLDGLGNKKGLLVKVRYWWGQENGVWLQTLHVITYLGPRV